MNSYVQVTNSLKELLLDKDLKVIALAGEWGVGKTHLWKEIFKENDEDPYKSSIYISIFGASDIDEIKVRILQNAYLSGNQTVKNTIQTGAGFLDGILEKFTGLSLKNPALLWLPKITAGKLVVIDDFERRGNNVKVQEIMGFLNEYSENYETRFLILINTSKLDEGESDWALLHEKVIDAQINLNPDSKECFEKAMNADKCEYETDVLRAVRILNIRNIRVIGKIIKNVNLIATKLPVKEIPVERWIPSIVLLTALAFKALNNAPSFKYVCSYNPYSRLLNQYKDEGSDEYKWNSLLDSLGINHTDDFELIFNKFLESGLLDLEKLTTLFNQYQDDLKNQTSHDKIDLFLKSFLWDAQKSESQLLQDAENLLFTAEVMSPSTITNMIEVIEELNDKELAERFIVAWESSLSSRPAYQNIEERIFDTSFQKIHSRILMKMNQLRNEQHPPLDIYDAAEKIIKGSGWGDRERIAFQVSTKEQYIEKIESLDKNQLHIFFKLHFEWFRGSSFDSEFENGKNNFLAACQEIISLKPESRITRIITRQFKVSGYENKLSNE